MINSADIEIRFTYHPPTPEKVMAHENIRFACKTLAMIINQEIPDGREKSLAITHLEDTMMWANAAIARSNN